MNDQPNLREWIRIQQGLDVEVAFDNGDGIQGTSSNISANGVLIESEAIVEVGSTGEITMTRDDGESKLLIRGLCEVVRSDGKGIAVHLSSLIGEESFDTLRNLILYNAAGDAEQADREFREHIGLRRPQQ